MAHTYSAEVSWERGGAAFLDRQYSRAHLWRFDGGVEVPASSSPAIVKLPLSREDAVDPEEALIASASSCHLLTFLDLAARQGLVVDRYVDEAEGVLDKRADGRMAMVGITLRPAIVFSGPKRPPPGDLEALHHRAHELCFIANSLNFEIAVAPAEPRFV
jgi:organic hydroperoxide reductase OsmC/OhrA